MAVAFQEGLRPIADREPERAPQRRVYQGADYVEQDEFPIRDVATARERRREQPDAGREPAQHDRRRSKALEVGDRAFDAALGSERQAAVQPEKPRPGQL